MVYEHRSTPPIPSGHFIRRVLFHVLLSGGLVLASLFAGMLGYRHFETLGWGDAFLNAAMLLGGMGPVNAPQTEAGKVFAGLYALYAGLVFVLAAGIMLAPAAHRIMHRLHWDDEARGP